MDKTIIKNSLCARLLRVFSRFKSFFKPLYLVDNTYYEWDVSSGAFVRTPRSSFFAIVARSQYQEELKIYPALLDSDLKKVLNLEYKSESYSWYIWPSPHQSIENKLVSRYVSIWKFSDCENKQHWIALPETFLLAINFQKGEAVKYRYVESGSLCWVARTAQAMSSAREGVLVKNDDDFILASGLSWQTSVQELVSESLYLMLVSSLKNLKLTDLLPFFKIPSLPHIVAKVFPYTLQVVIVFGIYLAISSFVIYVQHESMKSQIEILKRDTKDVFQKQAEIDITNSSLDVFEQLSQEKLLLTPFWLIYTDIKKQYEVIRIEKNKHRFIIEGYAERATDVLSLLLNDPRVLDARFDQPTRSISGKQNFVISFEMVVY